MKKVTRPEAVLALADGTIFKGRAFGAAVETPAGGEVVFNTSLYGYQEILTDPSYAGQMMCFTYPHIGNVGCNPEDVESNRVHVRGVIIRDLSRRVSNFRATMGLDKYLAENGVMGISDLDTRALVKHLRDQGSQMGALAAGTTVNPADLVDFARSLGTMEGKSFISEVSCREPYNWDELPWVLGQGYPRVSQDQLWQRPQVVAWDCGIKYNILRLLLESGFRVTVVPAHYRAGEILALNPDAVFISNGPGDPAALPEVVREIKELLGQLPIFGICLGHQLLALAYGGSTYKLKFGHRGGNHPVMDISTGVVEITVQNHGFAVTPDSLPAAVQVSHLNLNDRTVEGLVVGEQRTFGIQYHPEASPGPHDSRYLFKRFFESVIGYRAANGRGLGRGISGVGV